MNVKKILLMSLIAVAIAFSVGMVSAGLFDGLSGGPEAQDNVIEVDHISFNTTNVTKFKLFNQSEDEDGYFKYYIDENDTGYNVQIFNYTYVDDITWSKVVQYYQDNHLGNMSSQSVNGTVVYNTTANSGNHSGESRYLAYVQDDDLKIIVDVCTPDLNETVKMVSSLNLTK